MPFGNTPSVDTSNSPNARLKPVPIEAVQLEDRFWEPKIRQLRETTLPTQHRILEETGRIDNFRRAAGKIEKDFQGLYFNDSDVYKWLEGCAYSLAYQPGGEVERLSDEVIAEIAQAQCDDGYLNTYYMFDREDQRWTNLRDMHELYCAGHLFSAAAAHHRATGKRSLMDVALRFADCIGNLFGDGKKEGVPGHEQIEMGLIELYRETGEARYLKLAQFFLDKRGHNLIGGGEYHQDHKPVRELDSVVGHAVRALYLNAGAVDLYMETGEEKLMEAMTRIWTNMTERRMYVTGGVGARRAGEAFGGDYELPNEIAYSETCGAIANALWNWRMLLATGEARYADVAELATYNGALSGISLDGRNYFYVNPLASRGRHRRQRWFGCACCPTNIIRLIGQVPGMIYSTSDNALWTHLYVNSAAKMNVAGAEISIQQRTDYPWDGAAEMELSLDKPARFALNLRMPGWLRSAEIQVNGEAAEASAPGAYASIERDWKSGDIVRLALPMPIEQITAHPYVEANAGKIALKRGPLVYCMEDERAAAAGVVADGQMTHAYDKELLDGVGAIHFEGVAGETEGWENSLYRRRADMSEEKSTLRAIPYYAWANRVEAPMRVWLHLR